MPYTTPAQIVSAPIAWNTPNIATGVAIAALAAGDIIEDVWVECATQWNSATSASLEVGIADDDLNPLAPLATYNMKTATLTTADIAPGVTPSAQPATGARAVTSAVVYAKATTSGATSAGAATVYAIVRRLDPAGGYTVPPNTPGIVDKGEVAGVI